MDTDYDQPIIGATIFTLCSAAIDPTKGKLALTPEGINAVITQ